MTVDNLSQSQIKQRLQELDAELERALRARGFDPKQLDNVPLTPILARLQAERLELIEALDKAGLNGRSNET